MLEAYKNQMYIAKGAAVVQGLIVTIHSWRRIKNVDQK